MSVFRIDVQQTVTYNHSIKIKCHEADIDNVLSRLDKHSNDCYFGGAEDISGEIERMGVKVLSVDEDGSGSWDFEFDYDEDFE